LTNKYIISAVTSLLLISPLTAQNIYDKFECGQGISTKDYQTFPTPIKNSYCKNKRVNQNVIEKIVKIKNYQDLFQQIGIKNFYALQKSKKSKKFLQDMSLNDYTHTYLLYKKVVNFTDTLETLNENNLTKKNFITEIKRGGEFISLIHIHTNSSNDYKRLDKTLKRNFITALNKVNKTHQVSIKSYTTEGLKLIPSSDLSEHMKNFKNFEKNIKGEAQTINLSTYYNSQENLEDILKNYYYKNNLHYIKTHPEEFKETNSSYARVYHDITQTLAKIERNKNIHNTIMIEKLQLPKRYSASLDIAPIQFPSFSYFIKNENIKKNYPRIDGTIQFNFLLHIREDIKRDGKVIIETVNATIKANNALLAKEENSHIKLDTFINYPKLYFNNIKKNNIGTIEETYTFESYSQEKKIKGTGIIKEAICGYELNPINQKLKFGCKEIKLNPLQIEFKHNE